MTKNESMPTWIWLSFFAFAIFLHVMGIAQPFLGNFAQHQTDYATVVQRWLDYGINPLVPMMRFMAHGETRMFMGDIPWTMTLTAIMAQLSFLSVDMAGRAISVACFIFSLWPFKRILEMTTSDVLLKRWAIVFYIFSPLTIIYGQAFLLEVPALMLGLFGYYFFMKWYQNDREKFLYFSALSFSLMLGTRIYYAPALLPLVVLFYRKDGWRTFRSRQLCFFGLITLALPFAWQLYAMLYASMHGQESSLQDNFRIFVKDDPLVKENKENLKYYLPIFDIFLQKVVNPIGFVLAIICMSIKSKVNTHLKTFSILSVLCYGLLILVAVRKFVEFEYYYMPFVPFFAILAGVVLSNRKFTKSAVLLLMSVIALFSLRYSFAPVMITPSEFIGVDQAADKVREVVPKSSRVVASHRSTPFLYYVNRDGWAFALEESEDVPVRHVEELTGSASERLDRFRKQGAEYFALAAPNKVQVPSDLEKYLSQRGKKIVSSNLVDIYKLS